MKWKICILVGGAVALLGCILIVKSFLSFNVSYSPVASAMTEGNAIANDGVVLHWWKYERGTPLTTIVLHGGPEGNTEWMRSRYGDELADAFGTIVFYDRRGCGASQQTDISAEDMTFNQAGSDLMTVLQATTSSDTPIVLLGHSFGGTLLVHAAPLLGDRLYGVVFSSPFLDMNAEIAGRGSLSSDCVLQENGEVVPAVQECVPTVSTGWNANEHYLTTSHLEELATLTVPVILFTGECDILANSAVARVAQEILPSIEYHQLPLGSHRSMFESIAVVRPWIAQFMASLSPDQ